MPVEQYIHTPLKERAPEKFERLERPSALSRVAGEGRERIMLPRRTPGLVAETAG